MALISFIVIIISHFTYIILDSSFFFCRYLGRDFGAPRSSISWDRTMWWFCFNSTYSFLFQKAQNAKQLSKATAIRKSTLVVTSMPNCACLNVSTMVVDGQIWTNLQLHVASERKQLMALCTFIDTNLVWQYKTSQMIEQN